MTEFKVECADRVAVPAFTAFPASCNPGGPAPTATPTATATPTVAATATGETPTPMPTPTATDGTPVPTATVTPATITLNALASGFYGDADFHETNSGNYAVGFYTNSVPDNVELRDYFVFDLSTVPGTITTALLRLSTAPPSFVRYGSNDPSETYTLFDVSTAIATLTNGTGGTPAFDDLGGGTVYGALVATSAIGATVDVPLNAAGLAFLDASSGQIAIGGAITTLAKGSTSEFLFNATSAGLTRQLVVTIE